MHNLNGGPVNTAEAMQYLASLQLQAFQPVQMYSAGAAICTDEIETSHPIWSHDSSSNRNVSLLQINSPPKSHHQYMQSSALEGVNVYMNESTSENIKHPASSCEREDQGDRELSEKNTALPAQLRQSEHKNNIAALSLREILQACPEFSDVLAKALDYSSCNMTQTSQVWKAVKQQGLFDADLDGQLQAAEPATADLSVQTEMHGQLIAELESKIKQLGDELLALTGELEVQNQRSLQLEQHSSNALQKARLSAEKQMLQLEEMVEEVKQQAKLKIGNAKVSLQTIFTSLFSKLNQRHVVERGFKSCCFRLAETI